MYFKRGQYTLLLQYLVCEEKKKYVVILYIVNSYIINPYIPDLKKELKKL